MSWAKKLGAILGRHSLPDPLQGFTGSDGQDRIRNTLLQNQAIRGDEEIVKRLMASGQIVTFRKGERIIEQNAQGDDVYFLLTGEAYILLGKRKITMRSAPDQVGEMSAIEPGRKRSATVSVKSQTALALQVGGDFFRRLCGEFPDFLHGLHVAMASRQRERLDATQVAEENALPGWLLVSVVGASLSGVIVWIGLSETDWTNAARYVASGGVALAMFLFILIHNPAFFWRRAFYVALLSLIGKSVLESFVSFEATHGFESLQLSFVSGQMEADWRLMFIGSLPLMIAIIVCAIMEYLQTPRR